MKNRVRWNFNTVFGFKKNVLDRIPGYKRTVLKEECLYFKPNPILRARTYAKCLWLIVFIVLDVHRTFHMPMVSVRIGVQGQAFKL